MVVLNGVSKVYSNGQKALDNINLDLSLIHISEPTRKGNFYSCQEAAEQGKPACWSFC